MSESDWLKGATQSRSRSAADVAAWPLTGVDTKVRENWPQLGCEALVAVGADNVTYLSGKSLPFPDCYPDRPAAVVWTSGGPAGLICPADWAEAARAQGWPGVVLSYDENMGLPPQPLVRALTELLSERHLSGGCVGLDFERAPQHLLELLETALPAVNWVPCDRWLRDLRMIKTAGEVHLLESVANMAQRVILSPLNHVEGTISHDGPGYTITEFTERLRVHVCEFGGSVVGHLAAVQGPEAALLFVPPRGRLTPGNLLRIDLTHHHRGYWSDAGRMAVLGEPTPEQERAYQENLALKAVAASYLRPGVACDELWEAVGTAAQREGIRWVESTEVGHGLGVSHREPPFLSRSDCTKLAVGMVLVLDIVTLGPLGELMRSKDTFEIVPQGNRLLSWYKDWDRLYAVTGWRAIH